ncbi:hypothetical protein Celaphus_00011778 [Cervus elaphus hippelaphus]|uniref:Uncharacterized protein n=1 Tax=Cervus elaphus hippelaphus TaxID=46360 RepID=A0A212DEK8_CEREH|nr:hypothetical protein Celaphus_00011778 [Cervus elaphus hippelaphus]
MAGLIKKQILKHLSRGAEVAAPDLPSPLHSGLAWRVSAWTGSPPVGVAHRQVRPWTVPLDGFSPPIGSRRSVLGGRERLLAGTVPDAASGGCREDPLGRSCADLGDGLASPRCSVSARLHSEMSGSVNPGRLAQCGLLGLSLASH